MLIKNIIKKTKRPKLYQKTNSIMWTDNYISKQLLNIHLNPNIDLASRKEVNIHNTVNWILQNIKQEKAKILDLGCGPGLYSEILSKKGHDVTGIDFSKNSINYAKKSAKEKNLKISYINKNYLDVDLEKNSFDVVILIYTDFGVLVPAERNILLNKIFNILKPGGIFIFDVLNDKNLTEKITTKNWEASPKGFWRSKSYLSLTKSFLYEKEKVILYQHNIIDNENNISTYRFWTHFFSPSDLKKLLKEFGFNKIEFSTKILEKTNQWDGENVIFCKAEKL